MARVSSASSCTSTSAARPNSKALACKRTRSACSSAATMSRIASAPAARASNSWYSSTVKSFRRIGNPTPRRTAWRCSSAPSKNVGSVRTEIAAAPPCSYRRAMAAGSYRIASTPFDGERRLHSAITFTCPTAPRPRSNAAPSDVVANARFSSAASGSRSCRTSMMRRVAATMVPRRSGAPVTRRPPRVSPVPSNQASSVPRLYQWPQLHWRFPHGRSSSGLPRTIRHRR